MECRRQRSKLQRCLRSLSYLPPWCLEAAADEFRPRVSLPTWTAPARTARHTIAVARLVLSRAVSRRDESDSETSGSCCRLRAFPPYSPFERRSLSTPWAAKTPSVNPHGGRRAPSLLDAWSGIILCANGPVVLTVRPRRSLEPGRFCSVRPNLEGCCLLLLIRCVT